MAKSVFILDHNETVLTFKKLMNFNSGNRKENLRHFDNYLHGVLNGSRGNLTVEARMGETAATATITSTGIATADETFTLNGVVFTAKASGATGNQFNIHATAATQATNIVNAINGSTTAGVINVTASSVLGVVTLTCDVPGTIGNAMTLAEALSNVTVSGANLSGGANDTTVTWTA